MALSIIGRIMRERFNMALSIIGSIMWERSYMALINYWYNHARKVLHGAD